MANGVDFFIEETTKGDAQKVFEEMILLEMKVVCKIGMEETKLKVFDYLTERNFDPGGNAIFEVEGYVGYGQLKAGEKEGKLALSDYRVKGVNPFLFSCINIHDRSLKEEFFIEELVKIFGRNDVEKKCKKLSSLHTSRHHIRQDARIGDTNMSILCREITKIEFGLIWAAGTCDKTNPHFWITPNRSWQQEGKSNIMWRTWEKKRIKILCIQSTTVQPSSPNCCDDFLQPYIISMRVNHKIEFNKWSSIMCDSLEAVEQTNLYLKILQHIRAWRQRTIELSILRKGKMGNCCNSLITGKILVPAIYFRLAAVDFVGAAVGFNILYKWKLTTFGIHFFMIVVSLLIFLHLLGEVEYNSCFKYTRSKQDWEVLCYIGSFWKVITPLSLNMLIEFGWSPLKPKIQKETELMRDLQELMAFKYGYIYYFYGGCVVEDHRWCVETKCIEDDARMRFILHTLGILFGMRTQLGAPKFDSDGGVNDSLFPDLWGFLCEHYFHFNYSKTSSPTVKMTSPTITIIKYSRLCIFTIPCFMMWLVLLRALKLLYGEEKYYSILVELRCATELYNFGKQNTATAKLPIVCMFGSAPPSQTTNVFLKVLSALGSVWSTSKAFGLKSKPPDFKAAIKVVYKVKFVGLDGVEMEFNAHYDCYIIDFVESDGLKLSYSCNARACSRCAENLGSAVIYQSDGWLFDDKQMWNGYLLTSISYMTSDFVIRTHKKSD